MLENEEIIKKVFVIGHAYGSHSSNNPGLSDNVLTFVKKQNSKNQLLILTGDIVREDTVENLKLVRNQIETKFSEYYIAVGNHDIDDNGLENFKKVFKSDLNFINLKTADLIVANFTTRNWKPKLDDQNSINNFIKKSSKDTIIIFSHQVFWYNLTKETPKLNEVGREVEQDIDAWIKRGNKNIIVISGDYGKSNSETFCEFNKSKNILFIASGVYDNIDDKALVINETNNGFFISEIRLADF